jgi:hypothetical protein
VVAILGTFLVFVAQAENWIGGLSAFSSSVILFFWLALRRGIEYPWEPNILINLGFLGPITFGQKLRQLLRTRLVGPEIKYLFEAIEKNSYAVCFAIALAGFFAGAFAVFVSGNTDFSGAFAVILASAVAFAGASAVAFAGAVTSDTDFSVIIASAVAFAFAVAFAVFVPFAIPFAVVIAVTAGIGLGLWYRFKAKPEKHWFSFVAVLAFPWFCWLPITLIFATRGFHFLLILSNQYSPLNSSTWLTSWHQTALIELLLAGAGSLLWWRGHHLDQIARNPLQGGVVEQALRKACRL